MYLGQVKILISRSFFFNVATNECNVAQVACVIFALAGAGPGQAESEGRDRVSW